MSGNAAIRLAEWVLSELREPPTHLKLQKLCFYAYGFGLAEGHGDALGDGGVALRGGGAGEGGREGGMGIDAGRRVRGGVAAGRGFRRGHPRGGAEGDEGVPWGGPASTKRWVVAHGAGLANFCTTGGATTHRRAPGSRGSATRLIRVSQSFSQAGTYSSTLTFTVRSKPETSRPIATFSIATGATTRTHGSSTCVRLTRYTSRRFQRSPVVSVKHP